MEEHSIETLIHRAILTPITSYAHHAGTWHIGIKYPDIWAGLARIAPATFRSPNDLAKIKTTPVILVQGDKDRLVPVRGARRCATKMKEL